ncbi:MAG: hypothetical protein O7I93_05725 [Gemmatimonadetes bacterium]|nr:hypothetical protein [Gemmatimonadota bacterium]
MRSTVNSVSVTTLAAVFGTSALAFGWWILPVVGMAWGAIIRQSDHPVRSASLAAGIGAIGLLAWTGVHGPVADLARLIGAVAPFPMSLLYVIAIMVAAVLGATGGVVVTVLRAGQQWDGQDRRSGSLAAAASTAGGRRGEVTLRRFNW